MIKRRTLETGFKVLLASGVVINLGIFVSLIGGNQILALVLAAAALAVLILLSLIYSATGLRSAKAVVDSLSQLGRKLAGLANGIFKLSIGDLLAEIEVCQPDSAAFSDKRPKTLPAIIKDINDYLTDSLDFFSAITFEPCRRLFYIGSDSYIEGRTCGEALGKYLQGKGKLVVVMGDTTSVSQILRRKGALDYLSENYPAIEVLDSLDTSESREKSYNLCHDTLKRWPYLDAFYVTQGATPGDVARAVEDSGRQGKTKIICHDLTPPTMQAMAKGLIQATLSQDPYAQGYDPVIRLFNALVDDWRPDAPRLLTKLELIDASNMDASWDLSKDDYRSSLLKDHLAKLSGRKSSRLLKIGFLGISSEGFWKPVKQGFDSAATAIAAYGGQAEWVATPPGADGQRKAAIFVPALHDLQKRRFDAIVVPLFTRDLIPYINEVVDSGILVATYNSDPASLREMIFSASVHSTRLLGMSQEFAAEAEESGRSAKRIDETMGKILSSFSEQKQEVTRSKTELDSLVKNITKVETSAENSASAARIMATESRTAYDAIVQTRTSVNALETTISETARTISRLKDDTNRIKEIVEVIGDIANQTNILAINASIQAARSGEKGKGFAVIAAEIRKLAEQSNQSAESINHLIVDVGSSADNAEKSIVRGLADTKSNVASASRSEQSLSEITSAASDNEQRMADILGVMAEMAVFAQRVEKAFTAVLNANFKSEQAASEVDASTAEMASTAAVVTTSAHRLSDMAKAQQALLSQFAVQKK